MSYAVVSEITQNGVLFNRLTACAAEQKKPQPYTSWVAERIWDIAASSGWADAWSDAVAEGKEDPGSDESVITDQMILSVIQPMQ